MDKILLFEDMFEWAKRKDSYSFRDFGKLVGISYDELATLSKENEEYEYLYSLSKGHIGMNAFHAWAESRISSSDGLRYIYENDSEMQESLEEEGDPAPQTEKEFDEWFKIRLPKDQARYDL